MEDDKMTKIIQFGCVALGGILVGCMIIILLHWPKAPAEPERLYTDDRIEARLAVLDGELEGLRMMTTEMVNEFHERDEKIIDELLLLKKESPKNRTAINRIINSMGM